MPKVLCTYQSSFIQLIDCLFVFIIEYGGLSFRMGSGTAWDKTLVLLWLGKITRMLGNLLTAFVFSWCGCGCHFNDDL